MSKAIPPVVKMPPPCLARPPTLPNLDPQSPPQLEMQGHPNRWWRKCRRPFRGTNRGKAATKPEALQESVQFAVVNAGRRLDAHGLFVITVHRTEFVGRIDHVHKEPVRRGTFLHRRGCFPHSACKPERPRLHNRRTRKIRRHLGGSLDRSCMRMRRCSRTHPVHRIRRRNRRWDRSCRFVIRASTRDRWNRRLQTFQLRQRPHSECCGSAPTPRGKT